MTHKQVSASLNHPKSFQSDSCLFRKFFHTQIQGFSQFPDRILQGCHRQHPLARLLYLPAVLFQHWFHYVYHRYSWPLFLLHTYRDTRESPGLQGSYFKEVTLLNTASATDCIGEFELTKAGSTLSCQELTMSCQKPML